MPVGGLATGELGGVGGGGNTPLTNPTFSGIVTMPDGSTFSPVQVTFASPLTLDSGFSTQFVSNMSSNFAPGDGQTGFFDAAGTRNVFLVVAGFPANLGQDGQLYYFVHKGTTGSINLLQSSYVFNNATGGTFALTVAGFTQATAIPFNVSAATLQTTISDGTHGPAGSAVYDPGTGINGDGLVLHTTGQLAITYDFTGLTGGTGSSNTATVNGQSSFIIPPKSGVFLTNDGNNWYPIGTCSTASTTGQTAVASTPAPVTGTAFTPAANQDCELSFWVNTSAAFTVTYGPSTGAENTIINAATLPVGGFFNKRIPANWKVVITGTIADLSNILAVTC